MTLGMSRNRDRSRTWPLGFCAAVLVLAMAAPAEAYCDRHNFFDKETEQHREDGVMGLASPKVERFLAHFSPWLGFSLRSGGPLR